jgi:hypothetical protein
VPFSLAVQKIPFLLGGGAAPRRTPVVWLGGVGWGRAVLSSELSCVCSTVLRSRPAQSFERGLFPTSGSERAHRYAHGLDKARGKWQHRSLCCSSIVGKKKTVSLANKACVHVHPINPLSKKRTPTMPKYILYLIF